VLSGDKSANSETSLFSALVYWLSLVIVIVFGLNCNILLYENMSLSQIFGEKQALHSYKVDRKTEWTTFAKSWLNLIQRLCVRLSSVISFTGIDSCYGSASAMSRGKTFRQRPVRDSVLLQRQPIRAMQWFSTSDQWPAAKGSASKQRNSLL